MRRICVFCDDALPYSGVIPLHLKSHLKELPLQKRALVESLAPCHPIQTLCVTTRCLQETVKEANTVEMEVPLSAVRRHDPRVQ